MGDARPEPGRRALPAPAPEAASSLVDPGGPKGARRRPRTCQTLGTATTVVFVVDAPEVVVDGPGEVLQVPAPPVLRPPGAPTPLGALPLVKLCTPRPAYRNRTTR